LWLIGRRPQGRTVGSNERPTRRRPHASPDDHGKGFAGLPVLRGSFRDPGHQGRERELGGKERHGRPRGRIVRAEPAEKAREGHDEHHLVGPVEGDVMTLERSPPRSQGGRPPPDAASSWEASVPSSIESAVEAVLYASLRGLL